MARHSTLPRPAEQAGVFSGGECQLRAVLGSAKYLANYINSKERLPSYSLDSIRKAAGKVEEMMDGRFRLKRKRE